MKLITKILFIGLCLMFTTIVSAQSIVPIGDKTFFKKTDRQTFSVSIAFVGGTANYTKSQEGIEYLALKWALQGGVQGIDPIAVSKMKDSLGMEVAVESTFDCSVVTLTGLKKYWKSSFDLFTQLITKPSLNEDVFDDLKEELSLYAFFNQQDPEGYMYQQAIQEVFVGVDYAKIPEGSPSSINQLESKDVVNYLAKLLKQHKGFITIVGDFSDEDLVQIQAVGDKLFKGNELALTSSSFELPDQPLLLSREIETNYLRGTMISPGLGSKEGFPMLLGIEILSSRLFQRIRSEEGLSYDPGAYYVSSAIRKPYSLIQLDTENPSKAIELITEIVKDISSVGINEQELANHKVGYLRDKYLSQESTTAQSQALCGSVLRNQLLTIEELNQKVKDITIEDVNKALAKYLTNIHWKYMGNTELISAETLAKASVLD
ncbi:MAG: insulinase family protein [Ekhidna sp.]|nr:insulinase family protein [Ekhidna sp.]